MEPLLCQLENGEKDKTVTKLHWAAWRGDLDKVKKHAKKIDMNTVDGEGRTALHLAAARGHTRLLWHIVAQGGFINATDSHGSTPLQKVTFVGSFVYSSPYSHHRFYYSLSFVSYSMIKTRNWGALYPTI